jgi:hypothetical protein
MAEGFYALMGAAVGAAASVIGLLISDLVPGPARQDQARSGSRVKSL